VYATGTVVLGALAIGQEYSHHTLPAWLAQPVDRRRLLLTKLTVLLPMVATLAVFAAGAFLPGLVFAAPPPYPVILLVGSLPAVCAIGVAPWFTMVGRGPLAGAVFTVVPPGLMWAMGSYVGLPTFVFLAATMLLAAIGAVMTWRTFLRLESTGSHQAEIDLSAWLPRANGAVSHAKADRPRGQVLVFIRRELRMQQATFIVAGLYVTTCLLTILGRQFSGGVNTDATLFVATFMNSGLVAFLSGAVVSAEERRLGTADWHNLLPMAAWKQWAMKVAVAVGLTYVLAALVPEFIARLADVPGIRDGMEPLTVIVLCVVALYVSTLSTSGLRALLLTGPVLFILGALLVVVQFAREVPESVPGASVTGWMASMVPVTSIELGGKVWGWLRSVQEGMAAGFVVLLLWFGHTNHRTADRSPGRVAKQFAWLVAFTWFAALLTAFAGQVLENWARAHYPPPG
jgi:hypothetical protein